MKDQFGREIDYMRISVTDRCNFRCVYCMPSDGVFSVEHEKILRYEEILEIAGIAAELGIRKLRVTGGELFVRKGILEFLEKLVLVPGVREVSITTNGSMLEEHLPRLKQMGIRRVNVSLDTANRQRFREITGRDELPAVLSGIRQAAVMGFERVRVNCVPVRGINEEDLAEVAALAKDGPVDVRFIELMPLGCGRGLKGLSQDEVVRLLEKVYGSLEFYDLGRASAARGGGPAVYGHFPGFQGDVGFISAMSHEFCGGCSRVRLLADGSLKACLNYESEINLRELIRSGGSREEVKAALRETIWNKPRRHGFSAPGVGLQEKPAEKKVEIKGMSSIGG